MECQLQVWSQGSIHFKSFSLYKKWPQPVVDENLSEKAPDFFGEG